MIKFMMICFMLTSILLFGVLLGMQKANEGIKHLKGSTSEMDALTIEKKDGKMEAEVLGKNISSHELEEKQKKLEKLHSYNFFSSIGEKISNAVSALVKGVVSLIVTLFEFAFDSVL
ncbi:DUF3679 domain-containing protein [Fictibacillus sp. Mic-4]|uniref:DUF3679 domain-containing protein n=1 Tax=Fictibacillus TaxID=1329200 RepID=UPI00041DABED|nr:DUF3679 domain-containing protein [Fictibacillus gelatini]